LMREIATSIVEKQIQFSRRAKQHDFPLPLCITVRQQTASTLRPNLPPWGELFAGPGMSGSFPFWAAQNWRSARHSPRTTRGIGVGDVLLGGTSPTLLVRVTSGGNVAKRAMTEK